MAASAWNGEQRPGQLLVDAGRRGSQAVADRPARFPVRDSKAGEVEEQVGGIHSAQVAAPAFSPPLSLAGEEERRSRRPFLHHQPSPWTHQCVLTCSAAYWQCALASARISVADER